MSRILGFVLITLLAMASAALAEDMTAELAEAEELYDRHCGVCHGLVGMQIERAAQGAPAPAAAACRAAGHGPASRGHVGCVRRCRDPPAWLVSAWPSHRRSAPT